MIPYVFKNDIGTVIQVDVGSDVTGATTSRIKFIKPDGTSGYWNATISTQYLRYTTVEDDLDQVGEWDAQAYVELAAGKWHGEVTRFKVLEPIA
jgi:hypothetical protein